ncbi:NAD(P)-dependent oxidoreductase [Amycolatopsis nigrescens]|uniref:NAD(P)-dependent oxidoreductase n=1 Tax=Amycolatopsis nigrescens TaxID=381445 RepID=UPI00037764ED|nr:NAD(P)H-binding protein [Amycolatopsis nigrescens]
MHIVVFGGTGRIGSEVVRRALADGHQVTSVARRPPKSPVSHGSLTQVTGDATEPEVAESAVAGADAVVFAVGQPGTTSTVVRSTSISAILKGMRANGVKRLLTVSPAAVAISPKAPLLRKLWLRYFVHKQQRNPYNDVERTESELTDFADDIDWTIVRSAKLRDSGASGAYRVIPDGELRDERPVSTSDLADYLVSHVADASVHGATVTVVGPA